MSSRKDYKPKSPRKGPQATVRDNSESSSLSTGWKRVGWLFSGAVNLSAAAFVLMAMINRPAAEAPENSLVQDDVPSTETVQASSDPVRRGSLVSSFVPAAVKKAEKPMLVNEFLTVAQTGILGQKPLLPDLEKGQSISKSFGPNANGKLHRGIDLSVPVKYSKENHAIKASHKGVVLYAGKAPGAGFKNDNIMIVNYGQVTAFYGDIRNLNVRTGHTVEPGKTLAFAQKKNGRHEYHLSTLLLSKDGTRGYHIDPADVLGRDHLSARELETSLQRAIVKAGSLKNLKSAGFSKHVPDAYKNPVVMPDIIQEANGIKADTVYPGAEKMTGVPDKFMRRLHKVEGSGFRFAYNDATRACGVSQIIPGTLLEILHREVPKYRDAPDRIKQASALVETNVRSNGKVSYSVAGETTEEREANEHILQSVCFDPQYSDLMARMYMKRNLKNAGADESVSYASAYASHFLGPSDAMKLEELIDNPKVQDHRAKDYFKAAAKHNPVVFNKSDGKPRSISELYGFLENKLGAGSFKLK